MRIFVRFLTIAALIAPHAALAFDPGKVPPVVSGTGSAGDASAMSVTPDAGAAANTLARLIASRAPTANPTFSGTQITTPGTVTPQAIYSAVFPNVQFSDTVQGVLDVPAGDQRDNLSAVSGYVRTKSGGAGTLGKGNAVALFGNAQIAADGSAAWGINTLITDNTSRATGTGTGRIATGAELDFNIMMAGTHVVGVSIGGNSLAQPTEANGYLVNPLGKGKKWGTGFWSLDGAATRGLVLGALSVSGTNVASQPIWFQSFDDAGKKRTGQLQQSGSYLVASDFAGASWGGMAIRLGDLSLDPKQGVIVGGNKVVGNRVTGWTTSTGTPKFGAYNADYTQTISATYSQAQVQSLQNQLLATQQRVLALETALRTHGLIGP